MLRFFSLATLVLFFLLGLIVSPLSGESADLVTKKAESGQSTTVKKAPTGRSAPAQQPKASQPANRKSTPTKAAIATKAGTADKKASAAKRKTLSKKAPKVDDKTVAPKTKATASSGKQRVEKPAAAKTTTVSARKPAPLPANKTARQKKRPNRAPSVAASAVGNRGDIACQISAKSVMVMDANSGEAIFAKAPDAPRQPASTIKIVTGMIALKSLKTDQYIRVSTKAAGMPSSKINLESGNSYKANDLINAVLLASANDASVALAEGISGSEEQFANLMTMSARMWGATNTVCRTASGLTAEGQQSTARDLANLFRYAMRHEDFARRMHERSISTSYGKSLRNHNKALWRIDGADGGKTGYTIAARQTYVGQFSRDGHTIVVAIMGSESMWADLAKLVSYGFDKKRQDDLARGADRAASGQGNGVTLN